MQTVAVTRHESAFGTWVQATWTPEPQTALAGCIERIWYFDGTLGSSRERVFPDGTVELIVQLDTPHRPGLGVPAEPFPPVCVTGLRTAAEVVEAPPGRCRVLGVRLEPCAAFRLLGASLPELTGLTVDLRAILGNATAELAERVHAARNGEHAVRAAATWAARRIANGPAGDHAVQRARRDRRGRRRPRRTRRVEGPLTNPLCSGVSRASRGNAEAFRARRAI